VDDSVRPVDSTPSVTVTVVFRILVVVVVKAVISELSSSEVDAKTTESDSASAVEEVLAVMLVLPETSRLKAVSVREMTSVVVSVRVRRLETVTGKIPVEESSVSQEAVPAVLMESESRFVTSEGLVLISEVLLFQKEDIWPPAVAEASSPEVPVTRDDPEAVVLADVRASELVVLPALALEATDGTAELVSNSVDKEGVEIPREIVWFPGDACD
jgi:hypothetical protein